METNKRHVENTKKILICYSKVNKINLKSSGKDVPGAAKKTQD